MITEKLEFVKSILEKYEETRGDGNGEFLDKVRETLFGLSNFSFKEFNTESYTRARRKVLETNPHLDNRTKHTNNAEATVRREVA